jgi:hypothetical protein
MVLFRYKARRRESSACASIRLGDSINVEIVASRFAQWSGGGPVGPSWIDPGAKFVEAGKDWPVV